MSYCLLRDDDCHWYVVPVERVAEFHRIEQLLTDYWAGDAESSVPEFADFPDWAVRVGGAPSLVEFESYVIR